MTAASISGPIVIAGGSGFLGISLARHLEGCGTSVVVLSRNAPNVPGKWRHVAWDARTPGEWTRELDGAAALVNLVGRSVDCVKTPDHQDEILRSRVEATSVLGAAMRSVDSPPPVWVQMSTAHIYGDPPEVVCDEESPFGCGFAPMVGQAWENAFHTGALASQRKVILRTSFVIGRGRGAMARLLPLVRMGLGGTIGTGRQGISWIHEADMNRLFERALSDINMEGAYIATSPNPVSQRVFMREMRKAAGMPVGLPAFGWMVRITAPLLRTDPELAFVWTIPGFPAAARAAFRIPIPGGARGAGRSAGAQIRREVGDSNPEMLYLSVACGEFGQVGEWLKPTDCKSVRPCGVRRFESFPVHQSLAGRSTWLSAAK